MSPKLTKKIEGLQENVAEALAWSDKYKKDELLSAILKNIDDILSKL